MDYIEQQVGESNSTQIVQMLERQRQDTINNIKNLQALGNQVLQNDMNFKIDTDQTSMMEETVMANVT